jgi:DNA processing protein
LNPLTTASGIPVKAVTPQELLGPLTALEAKYAPARLYVAGKFRLPLLHPRVAIVGTREPSADGRATAAEISKRLAENGVTIVSGLARGVDTAVHNAAIQSGGYTIAVLGTPFSRVNPQSNTDLQRRIMLEHLAITQFSEQDAVLPSNFVIRNRTMALIGDASVIIESGDSGGSLSQGWETLRLGRPLFIHDQEFKKSSIAWPEKMARYGAIRFREPSDIMDLLPSASPSAETAILALEAA